MKQIETATKKSDSVEECTTTYLFIGEAIVIEIGIIEYKAITRILKNQPGIDGMSLRVQKRFSIA